MEKFWFPGRRSQRRAEQELADQLLAKQERSEQERAEHERAEQQLAKQERAEQYLAQQDVSMSPWGARALSRINYLYSQNEIEKCKRDPIPEEDCKRKALIGGIYVHLAVARKVVSKLERRRILLPFTDISLPLIRKPYTQGQSLETIWSHLRAADVAMLELVSKEDLASRSGEVLSMAEAHLQSDNPQRKELTRRMDDIKKGEITKIDRGVLIHTLDAAYGALDAELSRVRSLRTMLWVASGIVFAGVAALAAYGVAYPDTFHLCFFAARTNYFICPSYEASTDILAVEVAGLCGAALTVIASLRRMTGTSKPYGLPLAAAVLKFPTGALTAFLGVLFIRGSFIPGLSDLDSRAQVLGWAAIFGAAQHLVTRLVDTRAREALSAVSLEPGTGHGTTWKEDGRNS
ncbi:hypothetical protein [Streptomyces sioyaensis]|uniref:hypothetical protein n=1 Tax=Streptomyces sioyaensis TaxID=67364 RepID=UPI0037AD1448